MAAQALGVATAAASRFLVSQYNQVPTPVGIVYNAVDMAVSAIAFRAFSRDPFSALLASRIAGMLVASVVVTIVTGPIDLAAAFALNVTSFVVSFIMSIAAGAEPRQFLLV